MLLSILLCMLCFHSSRCCFHVAFVSCSVFVCFACFSFVFRLALFGFMLAFVFCFHESHYSKSLMHLERQLSETGFVVYLANVASEVVLIHRSSKFRGALDSPRNGSRRGGGQRRSGRAEAA